MRPDQKVLNGHPAVKVAIVQAAPVFFDREATVSKACAKIAEAAGAGAQIIVFSEAWISGYPYWGESWGSRVGDWMDVRTRFYDSTLLLDSDDTARLCAAAAKANAVVAIGCNEMDARPAVHTIYNTLLFIDNHGRILGRRRKIMPTFVERAIWGCGDGSDLQVFDTDYGRIGGLICGENLMTLARAHLIGQGEDFHIAVFPAHLRCTPVRSSRSSMRAPTASGAIRAAVPTPSRRAHSSSVPAATSRKRTFPPTSHCATP